MGTSKRYAEAVDRRMDARILERIARAGALQSLTPSELQLDRYALTIDPVPKPVRAWVRFGNSPALVDATANRWTSRAVGIEFHVGEHTHRCWVWVGAIEDHHT